MYPHTWLDERTSIPTTKGDGRAEGRQRLTTIRNGAPCDFGSGLPFISYARMTSLILTLEYGTDTA